MKHGRMQAKDLPDLPILQRIAAIGRPACLYDGFDNTAIPGIPRKLASAKMRSLARRGLVTGCTCGCRGDFQLTPIGEEAASTDIPAQGYLHTKQRHGRVLRGNPPRSISDDDLCATCVHCLYNPGMTSRCSKGWPTIVNADGYITECGTFQPLQA